MASNFQFHSNHAVNIRLEDNGTVAHRVEGSNKGFVFTKQAIPVGAMFEVKIIEEDQSIGRTSFVCIIYIQTNITI